MGVIRNRKPGKQSLIVNTLRERIVSGQLALGATLTSRQLQQEFQTGAAIVQAAVHTLVADGFLLTSDRAHTSVSLTPPHLSTYGVVFNCPSPLAYPANGTFDSVLAHECAALQHAGSMRLKLYFDVTGHTDQAEYQRLLADVHAQRLAGIFYANMYHSLALSLVPRPLPTVLCLHEREASDAAHITLNHRSFFERALDRLAAHGRSRVAIIRMADYDYVDPSVADWEPMVRSRGMTTYPHWVFASTGIPSDMYVPRRRLIPHIATATYLLLNSRGECPDSIIVHDDIFLESVIDGIHQSNLRIGQDIEVISHCNYPLARPDQVPVIRLGYCMRAVLRQAFRLIDLQRMKSPLLPDEAIQAVFADETWEHGHPDRA